jgi:hypothetical protein
METSKTVDIHPFEKCGLGKAPFRYIGMECQDIAYGQRVISGRDTGILVTTKPGGTCDACGQYILDIFKIKSADGKVSKVGCDCVLKVGMKIEALTKFKADRKALAKTKAEAKKAKEKVRIEAARRTFLLEEALLTDRPHPNDKLAARGLTLRDYAGWIFENAGHSGKLSVAKLVEKG